MQLSDTDELKSSSEEEEDSDFDSDNIEKEERKRKQTAKKVCINCIYFRDALFNFLSILFQKTAPEELEIMFGGARE